MTCWTSERLRPGRGTFVSINTRSQGNAAGRGATAATLCRSHQRPTEGSLLISMLKLHPAQALKKAIGLSAVDLSVEHPAISAKEPLVLFAQAACKIVVNFLHQE
jgi:hypothetical protein